MLILRNPALVAFEAVADLGTVHAAAKSLKLTQTALTLRIKKLESEMGMTLFLRSRRGMALTEEAKALLRLCRGQRELEGEFLGQVSGSRRREISLTVVGPTSVVSTRVAESCQHLYRKYPFLSLHFKVDDHSDLVELVRRGEADLAIVPPGQVPNEMDSKVIKPDRYLLVAPAKWKKRKLREIIETERVVDFHETDETTRKYFARYGLAKYAKRPRLYANNNETLIRLIKAGVGFGTLAETVAAPSISTGKLITLNQGKALEDALALVWYPRPVKQEYFTALVRAIV